MDLDYPLLLTRSRDELAFQTQAHDNLFQLKAARWDVDLDAGCIEFLSPQGLHTTAAMQVIGTINSQDGTWLWAWANPSIPPGLCAHSNAVKMYGTRHHIERLVSSKLASSESEAWDFTAIASKLGGGQGAYRGPSGTTLVFMTFG